MKEALFWAVFSSATKAAELVVLVSGSWTRVSLKGRTVSLLDQRSRQSRSSILLGGSVFT